MSTFDLRVHCLVAVIAAGCGDDASALRDAGVPDTSAPSDAAGPSHADAGPDQPLPLERFDWRTARGAPLPTETVTAPASELFALSGDGFVTRSSCENLFGCTYTWNDRSGTPGTRREHLGPVTSSAVSPDGRKLLLVALAGAMAGCTDGDLIQLVARGNLQLLDLATGAVGFELALRSNVWSASGFTPDGDWLFAAPIDGTACLAASTGLRSIAPPFAPPPGLEATGQFIQPLGARRWVVFRDHELGIADPETAGSFIPLGESPGKFEVTAGWLHVYLGFGEVVQDLVSVGPDGTVHRTELRDEDWFPFNSAGRWVRACQFRRPEGFRDCRVVDAQGEFPPVNFAATDAPDHSDDAVVLAGGAVAFIGPTPDGGDGRAVQRIDLQTGRRDILHAGIGALRQLGDGRGALLVQDGTAWLIDATREEQVADHVVSLLTSFRFPPHTATRQDDLAVIVTAPAADQFALSVLDLRTRRLARLTDHVRFTPRGLPFVIDDDCGQPWTTRRGGSVFEGFGQVPDHVFFAEEGEPATLWLLPVDLSGPPRRLAELAPPPARCHAPLAAADGAPGFAEDAADGSLRVTLVSGP